MLIVITLFIFIIISTAYSGNLVSFMTIPKLGRPIDTLEEVLVVNGRIITFDDSS